MLLDPDTIVAISTPPGRGGIGVVRLSGPESRRIAETICRLKNPLAPGRFRVGEILDPESRVVDEVVVTYFAAPHSYTTQDVVEIACHGAPVLLDFVVRATLSHGARLAEPGEFSQRAFLAGRIDLTQAEAVNDLIAAQTLQQARVAAAQLGGSVARAVAPIKAHLVGLIAALEAGIDFAEDDLDLIPDETLRMLIHSIHQDLEALTRKFAYGKILRDGFTLAIVGRPNVGKSSLFNRLLERDRAIVTAQPGTTRDPISERFSLDGVPVEIVDTAGLRDAPRGPEGEAETLGIQRTREHMADADFIILVVDATSIQDRELHPDDQLTLTTIEDRPHAVVLNKSDLLPNPDVPLILHLSSNAEPVANPRTSPISTSAVTGKGIDLLKTTILAKMTGAIPEFDPNVITNLRQEQTIEEAFGKVQEAYRAATTSLPHEMLLMDLHEALDALDRLTGQTSTDDILGLIFSTFCIGK